MTQKTPFSLFDASAGSGKTFQLVVQYLSLCLAQPQPDFYQRVLAITFTNKAAAEMKERVLSTLDRMVSGERSGEVEHIEKNTELSFENLQARALAMRTDILHNYHSFSISTIDYFTHKVIRTFAHDLKLPHAFEIEMDVDQMRREAIDAVLDKVGDHEQLTHTLLTYVKEQLLNDKSWKIEGPLLEISDIINKENSLEPLKALKKVTLSTFLEAQKSLAKRYRVLKAEILALGEEGQKLIEGIPTGSFHFGNSGGVPATFKKWVALELGPISSRTLAFSQGKRTGSKATASEKGEIESLAPAIESLLERGSHWLEQNLAEFTLLEEAQKNIFALALINEISTAWDELKIEQQKLPISDFNQLLNEQIKDQPTPYVYERMGEKYKHFFIDEFQDTSFLQFTNLLPLINNALSESGSCLLVGDAKQSIYRWRGGDASLFMALAQKERNQKITFANGHSLLAASQTKRLAENFRSKSEIVGFNNELFSFIGNQMTDPEHSLLYSAAPQEPALNDGGYVNLQVRRTPFEEEEIFEEVTTEIKALVQEKKAYAYSEICLLFRTNKEARAAVQYLLSTEIPVISGDALYVDSSPAVRWALSFLKIYARGMERETLWEFLKNYTEVFSVESDQRHALFRKFLALDTDSFWVAFEEIHPQFTPDQWSGKPLFSLLESALDALGVLKEEDGYLQTFLDLALEHTRSKDGSPTGFISWWEDTGHKKTVSLPEGSDAVQVLTLHKSKGLQFPVVFLPRLEWKLMRNPTDWIPTDFDDLGSLDFYLSLSSTKADSIGGEYAEAYEELVTQAVFDNVNGLYVGMTRACDRMYAYTFPSKKNDTLSVQKFLTDFVAHKGGGDEWIVGSYETTRRAPDPSPPSARSPWNLSHSTEALTLSSSAPEGWTEGETSPRYWGSLVHRMLQGDHSIAKSLSKGEISQEEADQITEITQSLENHPEVSKYYQRPHTILDERDLLLPHQGLLRPDRLVMTEDRKIVVIDYKTGEAKKAHVAQLNDYGDALIQAGYAIESKVLIYLSTKVEEVISW